ncbi:carbohydrate ABC transporter permease [Paenibacillus nasutitermitis]|uniref:Sugar ABC transporter permease n=1 Tax=Paenibacillus nasutitermitis TaxID=1652958 RepID=A0A916ZKT2_9BACL|nr:carbohydrate ABC transporter permease [Paenibacillus nasutitermitis]GGE01463.1 sugar ABC transporter permease [Paenibacillus nasutitermitis]
MRETQFDRIFYIANYLVLSIVMLAILYPLYFIVIASISDPELVSTGNVWIIPKGLNVEGYQNVFKNDIIWTGYANTIIYTILGTAVNLVVTVMCAYALSRKHLPGKGILMGVFVLTMFFGGGLIPSYILIKSLGLIDTRAALIIPAAMSVFNMIITRTFFQSTIPDEIHEASKMDGSSEWHTFIRIGLPLSAPIIAVMALFYGVGHWNQYFSALLFIYDQKLYPLQLVLRNILVLNQQLNMDFSSVRSTDEINVLVRQANMAESMKYALVFIASFPVLAAYPFVQKHFVRGALIGSLKG